MKKVVVILAALFLALSLASCSNTTSQQEGKGEGYRIAIIKQLDHASLDEIANAITAELDTLAKENGIEITYSVDSGNNDATTLQQYAANYVGDEVNCIIPIATLAAQTMASATEESKIPVVYAAISDPEGAELTNLDHVSGTSDALNTNTIMEMIVAQHPDVKSVGLLYSQSEVNSEKPIAEAEEYLKGKNIKVEKAMGNNDSEIAQAVASLIAADVDAIFTPTDNVVMATEITTAEKLIEAGIPHYTGADSFVRNGAYTTCGV
ncbi:MAG: ABC transporter substrate-binding protein, partial [Solobacterium sp.]|nr:ABC transporter substrate-binding protein [Solobacterium sp.]